MTATTLVDDRLELYGTVTAAAIAAYVQERKLPAPLADVLTGFTMRRGKGIRPALCLAACEAFGGTIDDALPAAAAVELLHSGFLIHDDIEDDTEQRRGRSAMHVELGVPVALNAGDALAVLSIRPLLVNRSALGSRMTGAVLCEFQRTMEHTVAGQAIELDWRSGLVVDLTPLDYLDLVMRKTCAYTTMLPLRVGALIGSWGTADLLAVARFGFLLGAAFQVQDDVLDLVSDRHRYGKDALGDIREGKRTLAVIHFLETCAADDRAYVNAFLAARPTERSAARVRRVAELLRRNGSVDFANAYARRLALAASDAFTEAFGRCAPSPAVDFVAALVPYMVERPA